MKRGFFITGTGTGVGKTVATATLGILLQEQGLSVGVMKPVQAAGQDAKFLKTVLGASDTMKEINPFYAPEPLSPHLAFKRQGIKFQKEKVLAAFEKLRQRHDVLLVEGAGGLLVPITDGYFMADLARDLDLDLVIVSHLGLGTINHTLLTIEQARSRGLKIAGVLFNTLSRTKKGIPEKTNPEAIEKFAQVPVLGTIPFLPRLNKKNILRICKKVNIQNLISTPCPLTPPPYEDLDKKYIWHPFTQMQDWLNEEPLVIDEAKGVWLKDTQGRKYIDGVSSLWVNIHGHGKKEIDSALKQQINKLSHSTMLGLSNTPAVELAQKLVRIAPAGLEKVFYSDNGSTSVEIAIKMAYQYWQNQGMKNKTRIAHLANSYHGDTLGSVSVGGIGLFHKVYRNLVFKTLQIEFPDCYRAPRGKKYPDYAFECVGRMEQTFRQEKNRIAAFVVEPIVQGAAGMIVWPQGVLRQMAEICKRYDILFIADEVATGFGRTGKMFACEHEAVRPDFLCMAKGLTGGYLPLAATLATKKVFDGFLFPYKDQKTFFHGHTYTGNPLCCAAALANLEVFAKEKTLQQLQPKIKYLSERLKEFARMEHVGDIRQKGFMAGIELVWDKKTKEPFPWEDRAGVQVCQEVRKRGVILRPLGNVIVLMPPLAITKAELGQLLDVMYWAIEKITENK